MHNLPPRPVGGRGRDGGELLAVDSDEGRRIGALRLGERGEHRRRDASDHVCVCAAELGSDGGGTA